MKLLSKFVLAGILSLALVSPSDAGLVKPSPSFDGVTESWVSTNLLTTTLAAGASTVLTLTNGTGAKVFLLSLDVVKTSGSSLTISQGIVPFLDLAGSFGGASLGGNITLPPYIIPAGGSIDFTFTAGNTGSGVKISSLQFNAVPEPGNIAILGGLLASSSLLRFRRRGVTVTA